MLLSNGFCLFSKKSFFIPRNLKQTAYSLLFIAVLLFFFGCNPGNKESCQWHCFHGPDRTNKSEASGLLNEWPEDGPSLKWTASGLGEGYSSVAIADGYIYTAGKKSDQTLVFCFDMEGNPVWEKPNGKAWSTNMSHASSYTGARSTPTFDNGVIYHMGETGRLTAFDARTGDEIWASELAERFDAPETEYGYSESVMIDGDKLYVRPAGKDGYQVCLNKHDGDLIWATTGIPGVEGYSSPVIMEFDGYRQLINASSDCYYSVDTETGKLLWKMDYRNRQGLNVADAVVQNEYVFISSGYGLGSMLIELRKEGDEIIPETVWQSELMDNHHGGLILHEGYLYGSGSKSRGWFCLNFLTGDKMWETSGKGSVTFAENKLYLLDERGFMKLAKAVPDSFVQQGEFEVPEGGRSMYWAHPVVCGKTLYVRHADKLFAYDVGEGPN